MSRVPRDEAEGHMYAEPVDLAADRLITDLTSKGPFNAGRLWLGPDA